MFPVGAIFVPFPLKTGTNMLHPLPPQSLNLSFGDVNPKLAVNESLASICRNVQNDKPYHSARPRNFEISTQSFNQLEPVLNDCELFASAVTVFPLIDPEAFVKLQNY